MNSELTSKVEDANQAFTATLKDVLNSGEELKADESDSVGSNKKFKEILNYHLIISDPVQRLLSNSGRNFNLPGAIARFVWMMAANNRLADIEFYWGKKISRFTDDGITVPGSSYGARMFNASPGLDQIEAVIKRLQEDKSTRRAAVSIYHPIDAIRSSKDIPCTFGLFYHIRDKQLVSTIVMRSNNAFILLPYNIFEFSLLAEIIAKEVGVEVGCMHYHALSMHIYEENYEAAEQVIQADTSINIMTKFPAMPFEPKPMSEVKKLARLEAEIRHQSAGINNTNIDAWLEDTISIGDPKIEISLNSYWKQFYYLILYFIVLNKTSDREALQKVAALIHEPYKSYLEQDDSRTMSKVLQQDLFGNIVGNPAYADFSFATRKLHSFEMLVNEHNDNEESHGTNRLITVKMSQKLREKLVGDLSNFQNIAARNDSSEISKEDFRNSVNDLFGG